MNRMIPTLCLSTLLLACAHDAKHERSSANARASGDEQGQSAEARANRAEARANREANREEAQDNREEARENREERAERVELKRRGDGDRLASRDAIPARDADNTEVNNRDRDGENVTPLDQGNGEIDLELTQRIRKGVMADDSLSFGAKNVKIITRGGHVTLRGAVNTAAEKEAINKTALMHAGVGHVSNELEIDD